VELPWRQVEEYLRGALGAERFAATARALATPPRCTCLRVNTIQTTPEAVLAAVRELLGPEAPPDAVWVHPQVGGTCGTAGLA
jgi:16S rRNA C967 or C1407 C5-methylase (RsmB/RsmF family)